NNGPARSTHAKSAQLNCNSFMSKPIKRSLTRATMLGLFTMPLVAGLLVAGLATASSAAEAPAGEKSWPLFRGDSQARGIAHAQLPERPEVLWKFKAENGVDATAVIDAGTVYVGDANSTFYALALDSGEVRWTFKTELGFAAPAAVRDGRVYVGDVDGNFY